MLPTFGKAKLRRFPPGSKSCLFGGVWGVLANEKISNFRHLDGSFSDKFGYFCLEIWRFHGCHTENTEVSPLLLLNYGFTELAHLDPQIRRSPYFLRRVGNTGIEWVKSNMDMEKEIMCLSQLAKLK